MHTRTSRIAATAALAAVLAGLGGAALAQDATWTEMRVPIDEGRLGGIHFADKDTGWIAGVAGSGDASRPVILHTADGGETWTEQESPVEQGALNSVTFAGARTGYAVGQDFSTGAPLILRTTDGGDNWTQAQAPDVHGTLDDVAIASDGVWCSGIEFDTFASLLMRSDDGLTWAVQAHPAMEGASLAAIAFATGTTGAAVGSTFGATPAEAMPLALRTTDGGGTWTEMTLPLEGAAGILSDVAFAGGGTGWLAGGAEDPFVLRTTDGGETWTALDTPGGTQATSLSFVSPEEGFVSINREADGVWSGTVYHTGDGGESWTPILGEMPGEAVLRLHAVRGSLWLFLAGIDKQQARPTGRKAEITRPEPTSTPTPTPGTTPPATTETGAGGDEPPYIGPAIPVGPRSAAPPLWTGITAVTAGVIALLAVLLRALLGGRGMVASWVWVLAALAILGALGAGVLTLLAAGGPLPLFVVAALVAIAAAGFGAALPMVAGRSGAVPPWLVVAAALAACGVLGVAVALIFR